MRPISFIAIIVCFSACAPLLFAPIGLSTYQAGKAMAEGAAALPYLARSTVDINEINLKQVNQKLKITVADTYRWAYGKNFDEVPSDGDTGHQFKNMRQATQLLQKVLAGYGIENPDKYVFTSIDTAKSEGLILFAAVNRQRERFAVDGGEEGKKAVRVTKNDPAFYSPYQKDAAGRSLDRVVDWAALTTECYQQQIHQAMLLTMEANKIITEQAKPGFWQAREKWLAGGYMEIFETQDRQTCAALDIEAGQVEPPQ
ncbi:MAG: hypothetical protein U5L07_07050 [Desulfobacterales bacterium]|nr:hypothetical protein [Desulfobacterales bacterium]